MRLWQPSGLETKHVHTAECRATEAVLGIQDSRNYLDVAQIKHCGCEYLRGVSSRRESQAQGELLDPGLIS